MELGEPGADGRRQPVPIAGSEYVLPANVAIIGLGTTANPLIQSTTPDLATNKRNYIVADPETMRTSKRGVFAGGDIVTGGATVILAMGAGRKAAASIHEYLTSWRVGGCGTKTDLSKKWAAGVILLPPPCPWVVLKLLQSCETVCIQLKNRLPDPPAFSFPSCSLPAYCNSLVTSCCTLVGLR